jgi:hypothetical protein
MVILLAFSPVFREPVPKPTGFWNRLYGNGNDRLPGPDKQKAAAGIRGRGCRRKGRGLSLKKRPPAKKGRKEEHREP